VTARGIVVHIGLSRGRLAVFWVTGLTAAIVMAGGIVMALRAHHSDHAASAVTSGSPAAGAHRRGAQTTTALQALRVVSSIPNAGARDVDGTRPIRLTLSGVPAASSPLPRLSPSVPGTWSHSGTSLIFTPSAGFPEDTQVTISEPGRRGHGQDRVNDSAGWAVSFSTASYSTLRLQQLLAQLGYLPLTWSPHFDGAISGAVMPSGAVTPGGAEAQLSAAYQPPAGQFTWVSGYPSGLPSFWQQGAANLIDTGAIMAFESDHGLALDGVAGPKVWTDLLRAAETQQDNPNGYTYAIASEVLPETLTIWHDGHEVFSSLANTGIPIAPTSDGTFPVYLRYRFQVMQGTNPDGTHYADPVQYVSYFEAGEAVHYFPRYSYGFPQSLGCVELPLAAAAQAWPYLTYGSLVTVSP
jgi:peptidoglycan hydrolase-like protein with peptidoglycan-binding domain